jgi:hypothetical protein
MVIVFGIGLRFVVALRGHNFDFDSYLVVRDIVKHGFTMLLSLFYYVSDLSGMYGSRIF